jgi:aerobic C4-dicarboxylate transport protein
VVSAHARTRACEIGERHKRKAKWKRLHPRGQILSKFHLQPRELPFYRVLWVQVLVAIALAIVLGYVDPARAIAMKPLGDAFIRMITMIITLIIFCTVVTGIAGMENLKKVGRVGGLALLYFEVVSTVALLIGLVVGNVVHPGSGFNVNVATLDAKSVAELCGPGQSSKRHRFPDAHHSDHGGRRFRQGRYLEVVFVALLFGFALSAAGARAKPLVKSSTRSLMWFSES